ncbi:MAG TPA: sulfotransferase [Rhizomicrobium sp.]|nr:sulfotransferase [Rhizomicrobium sp.]
MREKTTRNAGSVAESVHDIDAAIAASDYGRAAALADAASARGVAHPIVPIARALWFERQGRDEAAVACFENARTLSPRDARLPNAIGFCLARLGRVDEARRAFADAVRLEPSAAAHQRHGWVLALAGRVEDAERAYERALKLAPHNVETLASLASLAARKGNAGRARAYAERALALDPHNANAHVALAIVEVDAREYRPAIERLRSVLANSAIAGHERSIVLGLLGDALDGENTPREAFAAYATANAERRKIHGPRFAGEKSAREILDEIIAALAESPPDRWRAAEPASAPDDGPSRHVFLLGFPRSGTTVLEQALARNSQITTMDEHDFLADMAGRYLSTSAGLATLSRLDETVLTEYRTTYWQRVHALGLDPARRVFVDKQPFHTIKLPLIARLFPGAGVIFAIRDPRDVVLSCFRRQLEVDLLRFEFLTLEGAAGMYDRFMRLADLARATLPLLFFDHRYEDLIAGFDTTTQRLCTWLGVPWQESMRDVAAQAQSLDAIKTSTRQIRRGLYGEGVGQWRRYREELLPVLQTLQPWIARFGYPESRGLLAPKFTSKDC